MNFPVEDGQRIADSLHRIERAVKAHHALLTKLARKHGATDGQVTTFSGGTDKDDDDDQPNPGV